MNSTILAIVLITLGIGLLAFVIGFLLRKFVPSYGSKEEKIDRREAARHNVENLVVDPEHDIASITEQELIRKEKIRKIKREAKSEAEENRLMVEQDLVDDDEPSQK